MKYIILITWIAFLVWLLNAIHTGKITHQTTWKEFFGMESRRQARMTRFLESIKMTKQEFASLDELTKSRIIREYSRCN